MSQVKSELIEVSLEESAVSESADEPLGLIDTPTVFLQLESDLNNSLKTLTFKDQVPYVYRPFEYAYEPHSNFVQKYCTGEKKILLLGMNPGPWGMCQTGVPFGDVRMVRDWFQIGGYVSKPAHESPKKQVEGFACLTSEESGSRLYGYFKELCGTPDTFFKHAFVHNYCPLSFINGDGGNVTPQHLKGPEKEELEKYCDVLLVELLKLLRIETVIAFGRYSEGRAEKILREHSCNTELIYVVHPSPLARMTRADWQKNLEQTLIRNDLLRFFKDFDRI